MLKVFLVEDEYIVRESIKKNVDWRAHGYDFCGEAGDGELAFPMIRDLKPDIVITDIKMPFMDGLELSRRIRQKLPWTEIIILTGYAEFEYAKEGIQLGVARYLTKPISGDELIRAVDELAEKIRARRAEQSDREKVRAELEERFSELVSSFKNVRLFAEQTFPEDGDFHIETVDPKQIDREKIREFLRFGDAHEIEDFTGIFLEQFGTGALRSRFFRQYITMDTYFCAAEFLENMDISREEIDPLDISPGALDTEEDALREIRRIFRQTMALRDQKTDSRYRDVVAEAIQYIEQNYANEDLSLNDLAAHVSFSANHLSTVFSRQTGQPFVRYLTDVRMGKARELLRSTELKTSSIAQRVGYKDPHYFSYLFKKTQGMTPTQYRNGGRTEEE